MEDPRVLGRREFNAAAIMALLSGVAITVSGCGGGMSSPTQPSPATGGGSGDKTGAISANHGHSAVVTSVQLTAAGAVRLDIRGSANHAHIVDLSAADIGAIAGGQRVSRDSSTDDDHRHTVTFN
jgi:hypothetical protein